MFPSNYLFLISIVLNSNVSNLVVVFLQVPEDSPSLSWLSHLRTEMLSKAGQLFERCLECVDGKTNSYVHYLMLGKVAEKAGRSYDEFLDNYMKVTTWHFSSLSSVCRVVAILGSEMVR